LRALSLHDALPILAATGPTAGLAPSPYRSPRSDHTSAHAAAPRSAEALANARSAAISSSEVGNGLPPVALSPQPACTRTSANAVTATRRRCMRFLREYVDRPQPVYETKRRHVKCRLACAEITARR